MWTEIMSEHIGVTHVGEQKVVFPIREDELTDHELEECATKAKQELERRAAWDRFVERMQQMRTNIQERERAQKRLVAAGYDPSEVPL